MASGPTFYLELWDGDILAVPHTNSRRQHEARNGSLALRKGPEMVPSGS